MTTSFYSRQWRAEGGICLNKPVWLGLGAGAIPWLSLVFRLHFLQIVWAQDYAMFM